MTRLDVEAALLSVGLQKYLDAQCVPAHRTLFTRIVKSPILLDFICSYRTRLFVKDDCIDL
jgi:hypothetical protein